MRTVTGSFLFAGWVVISCSVASGGPASRAWIPDTTVQGAEVVAEESGPTRFTLVVKREMPTPGWTFQIDTVEVDADSQRVTVKLTEAAPVGMVAQVLTPARIEIPLGTIEPGAYFVELWTRREAGKPHGPSHALLMIAR
jgi:hypothetical protein